METAHGTPGATAYLVVANDYEQYAIWPASKPIPPDWAGTGAQGTLDECQLLIRIAQQRETEQ